MSYRWIVQLVRCWAISLLGNTGGWNSHRQIPANASGPTGVHKLYVAFTSGYPGDYVNLDRFQLQKAGQVRPDLVNVTTRRPLRHRHQRHDSYADSNTDFNADADTEPATPTPFFGCVPP